MFKRLNIYTILTFVVYPVLFIGVLLLLFSGNCGSKIELQRSKSMIENRVQEFRGDSVVWQESSNIKDSLYYPESDLSHPAPHYNN